ncbi:MAG: NAD(P)H-hydrate dehydratase [Deltaproteobacteria bacterium]|nr:NAD(P)H-hydrate dehydratase [Deltaproteobacteria bacterium]
MRDGVWPLVGAAAMRALDRHTIETLGVAGALLMESAGRAVAEAVLTARAAAARPGDVLVVCGAGNNGGDGLVAARHLALLGVPVRAALVAEPKRLAPDAAANLTRARAAGVPVAIGAPLRTAGAAVIVDALFGTGLTRPVTGAVAAAIQRIATARPGACVVAVDLPSGLDADTGQCHGPCVAADLTVTIALPKLGLALEPGRTLAGRIVVARIGIADAAPGVRADAELWTAPAAAARLPARPPDGHKGSFGHVLLIAGARGTTGAAALAAEAAARAGAGLVTIACPAGVNEILEVKCTEMMTAPVPDGAEGGLAAAALGALLALARERDVVALGPGIGRTEETRKLVRELAPRIARPLVVDADGLFPFGAPARGREGALGALKGRRAATILTPHPGEAARLLGASAADVNRDRVGSARRLAEGSGAVVVLKGAATVVAAPDGRVAVNPTGGPALGTGGTGDVLTGVIAALLAQERPSRRGGAFESAVLGAWLHGQAGDRLSARRGRAGVLAGEVAAELPEAIEALRRGAAEGRGTGAALALPFP